MGWFHKKMHFHWNVELTSFFAKKRVFRHNLSCSEKLFFLEHASCGTFPNTKSPFGRNSDHAAVLAFLYSSFWVLSLFSFSKIYKYSVLCRVDIIHPHLLLHPPSLWFELSRFIFYRYVDVYQNRPHQLSAYWVKLPRLPLYQWRPDLEMGFKFLQFSHRLIRTINSLIAWRAVVHTLPFTITELVLVSFWTMDGKIYTSKCDEIYYQCVAEASNNFLSLLRSEITSWYRPSYFVWYVYALKAIHA